MLSVEDNELLCRVEGTAAMGALVRRYWVPFLTSEELPAPDGDPVRVKLFGEDLVAFRDTSGKVGLVEKSCPHRRADLFFGRNEEGGLRCTYHGWKYDVEGRCVDMASEPSESNFKDKVRVAAYPVSEAGGILWTYMGPSDAKPELPEMEFLRVPDDHRFASWNIQASNFVQAIEGGIDSVHGNFLHSQLDRYRQDASWKAKVAKGASMFERYYSLDRQPKFFTKETDYGLVVASRRETGEDNHYWRFNLFLMPFYSMPPANNPDTKFVHAFVPIDDYNCARWTIHWNPFRPFPPAQIYAWQHGDATHSESIPGTHTPVRNMANDYLIDRDMQRQLNFTGIKGIGEQDYSVQEGMGPISDRSKEHLGVTDQGVITMRRQLLRALRELDDGIAPYSALHGAAYRVIGGEALLPRDADWYEHEMTQQALAARV